MNTTWTDCSSDFSFNCVFSPPDWEKRCAIMFSDGQDGRVFLERLLEIQLCGNTGLVKYRLMACESCISILLMCIFFSLKA